jgi:hypothetical protein
LTLRVFIKNVLSIKYIVNANVLNARNYQKRCIEKEEMEHVSEGLEAPLTINQVKDKLEVRLQNDHSNLLHNVSGCHLPASRKIIQKRYQ